MRAPRGMLLALQAVGVAAAVPALVVVADDGREVARHAQRVADALADLGVLAHDAELVVRQRAGLVEDVLGDADLADVVQQGAVGDALQLAVAQAHVGSQARRAIGQVAAVVLEPEVLGLDRVGQGDHDVVRLLHAPDDLAGPKGAAQASQELDLLEGLGHEVVRAGVEGRDHVRGRRVRREHDDGQRHGAVVGPQAPADLQAVHAGQGEVEDDHVRLVLGHGAQPVHAVGDGDDAVAGVLEDATQDAPDGRVILDDCHAGARSVPGGQCAATLSLHGATTT